MCLETLTDESTMGPSNVQRSAIKYTLKNPRIVDLSSLKIEIMDHFFCLRKVCFVKFWENIGKHDLYITMQVS